MKVIKMLKSLPLKLLFLSIIFTQNISVAQSQNPSNNHYFYVIGKADSGFAKAFRSIPLIGPVFGKNLNGQGLFIKNDNNGTQVFFMGVRKNAKKTSNGFEFETTNYRFKVDQSNSKLIRISKISEQNTVKKIDLNLISKGADLSAFVHSSELVNYVPKTEAIKLRNALMSMDREYKKLVKENNNLKTRESNTSKSSSLSAQNAALKKEIQALQSKLAEMSTAVGKKNGINKTSSVEVEKLKMEISELKSELQNAKNTIQALLNSD